MHTKFGKRNIFADFDIKDMAMKLTQEYTKPGTKNVLPIYCTEADTRIYH